MRSLSYTMCFFFYHLIILISVSPCREIGSARNVEIKISKMFQKGFRLKFLKGHFKIIHNNIFIFKPSIGLKNEDIVMKNLKMSFWELHLDTLLRHFWNFDFNISGTSNLSIWRNTSEVLSYTWFPTLDPPYGFRRGFNLILFCYFLYWFLINLYPPCG